jgi:hypothetical protein
MDGQQNPMKNKEFWVLEVYIAGFVFLEKRRGKHVRCGWYE